jgi:iron(III) transport system ATP-binding protein
MSGGQQQRVALARSLAVDPPVVLFDEPLSNVDAKVRDQLRQELVSMQRTIRFAGVYVTHDQLEAMQLADRLAVMDNGRIVQIDTPIQVYRHPVSRYVACFVGQANELQATVTVL